MHPTDGSTLERAPILDQRGRPRDVPLGSPGRPTWRGRIHLLALTAAVPLLVVLAVIADGARARAGVIVYAVGLCAMLGVSTTYHRWVHTVRARAIWRRADHATIFAAIAGTFSAFALIVLGLGAAITLLIVMWGAAAIGAAVKILDVRHADKIGAVMYIATGWTGVLLIPALLDDGGLVPLLLLFAGGVMYTLGAFCFSRKWPTLRPATFGFHEVWHLFTFAAAGLHLAAVWILAT